eukprot:COSAG05_NODE_14479_length_395_cov_1.226351_1_plen_83_part_01
MLNLRASIECCAAAGKGANNPGLLRALVLLEEAQACCVGSRTLAPATAQVRLVSLATLTWLCICTSRIGVRLCPPDWLTWCSL